MFDLVLYQPEIPPNTGNVIRLCANTGCRLHLVAPLGFTLEDRQLRRAGLDYHEYAELTVHAGWQEFRTAFAGRRLFALSTRGQVRYDAIAYREGDGLVFGPETRGLPQPVLEEFSPECRLRLPMRPGNRSLNLSNACAVTVFEAWRQLDFCGG